MTQRLWRVGSCLALMMLASAVMYAQPGAGPMIRSMANFEATVMGFVGYLAVIAVVGVLITWIWEPHGGHMFGLMVKLAFACAGALGARELIAMFR